MSDKSEVYERGLEIKAALGDTPREGLDRIDQEFSDLSIETVFGGLWARDGLCLRDRVLITLATIIALGREPMAVKPNIRRAIRLGVSDREFREMLYQVMHYAGWSIGGPAMRNYKEVLAELEGDR
ncbi:carboxymuconolactone decarboxylase family protein [Nitrospinota bacterium]